MGRWIKMPLLCCFAMGAHAQDPEFAAMGRRMRRICVPVVTAIVLQGFGREHQCQSELQTRNEHT